MRTDFDPPLYTPRESETRIALNPSAPDVFTCPLDVVAAAREFVQTEGGGCVVSIGQLLEELGDRFGDHFRVTPEMYQVLDLVEALWDDPHIDQVPNTGWIEFAWNECGQADVEPPHHTTPHHPNLTSLRAKLLGAEQ